MLTILVYTFHVLICFFLIAVVLLQQGKGADLSVFGGGGTQTAFGARGAATVLHKMTIGSFVAFILTTLIIGVLHDDSGSSVLEELPENAAAAATQDPADGDATDEGEAAEDEVGALPTGGGADSAADEGEAVEGEDAATDAGTDAGTEGGGDAEGDGESGDEAPSTEEPAGN